MRAPLLTLTALLAVGYAAFAQQNPDGFLDPDAPERSAEIDARGSLPPDHHLTQPPADPADAQDFKVLTEEYTAEWQGSDDTTRRTVRTYSDWLPQFTSYAYRSESVNYFGGQPEAPIRSGYAVRRLPGDVVYTRSEGHREGSGYFLAATTYEKPIAPGYASRVRYEYDFGSNQVVNYDYDLIESGMVVDTLVARRYEATDSTTASPTGRLRVVQLRYEGVAPTPNGTRAYLSSTTRFSAAGELDSYYEYRSRTAYDAEARTDSIVAFTSSSFSGSGGAIDRFRSVYAYSYDGGVVTIRQESVNLDVPGSETYTVGVVDESGAPTSYTYTYYSGQDATPANLVSQDLLTYDAEGNLLDVVRRRFAGADTETGGNLAVNSYRNEVSGTKAPTAAAPSCGAVLGTGANAMLRPALDDRFRLVDAGGRAVLSLSARAGEIVPVAAPRAGLYALVGERSGCVARVYAGR